MAFSIPVAVGCAVLYVFDGFPMPSAPAAFEPQQFTAPVDVKPQAKSRPASIATNVPVVIGPGATKSLGLVSRPSCEWSFLPQQNTTLLGCVSAQEKLSPLVTATAFVIPGT